MVGYDGLLPEYVHTYVVVRIYAANKGAEGQGPGPGPPPKRR